MSLLVILSKYLIVLYLENERKDKIALEAYIYRISYKV